MRPLTGFSDATSDKPSQPFKYAVFWYIFRAEGINVGIYYSLIDWHHPDFTIDSKHPLRPNDTTAYAKLNAGKDMNKYRAFLYDQVQELFTNYKKKRCFD